MEIPFLPCRHGSKTTQVLPFMGSHRTSLPKYHSHSHLVMCAAVLHWLRLESLGLSWWGRQSAAPQSAGMGSHGPQSAAMGSRGPQSAAMGSRDRSCSQPSRWESCIKLHRHLNLKNLPCFWVATLKLCVVTI